MREINLNRQLLGLEDLLFGTGTVLQTRAGEQVPITKINAGNLPFNETQTLLEWVNTVNLEELGSMTDELHSIYNNLASVNIVANDTTEINALAAITTELHTLYVNISAIQNNSDNMVAINSLHANMTALLSIYTNIVPNLTEILAVDTLAAQVAQDKIDVTAMKLAVESIFDSFDDRFLGAKSNDPTVDNDGNPLVDSALYFNSSSNALKVYSLTDTTWYTIPQIYLSGLLDVQLTSITTGDILNWNGTKWVNTRTPKFSTMQLTGGTGTEGTLSWNTDEGTVDIILPNGSILQVGQEGIRKVRNGTASTITNGTVVMFDGTIGNSGRIKVKPFTGGFNEALYVYGIATQDILAGADGIITTEGKIRGINTTGSLVGETWADEDILYAKPSDAGALTKVLPGDSQLKMIMASVIHAHTNGTLEIRFTPINENTWYTKVQADALADIHSKTAKATPVDADEFMIADSASTWSLKKITWANIKTALTSLFIPRVVTTTNKAIARYNGTNGDLQNSAITIDDNGNIGSGTQSFNGFGGSGFKNYLYNPKFDVAQRGTVFVNTITTGKQYTLDRWSTYFYDLSNTRFINTTPGEVSNNAIKFGRFDNKTDTYPSWMAQELEIKDSVPLRGKTVTISFWAKKGSGLSGNPAITFATGTTGDESWTVVYTGAVSDTRVIPLTTTLTKYTYTYTLNSNIKQVGVTFVIQSHSVSATVNDWVWIEKVQLEEGSIATPFENRPYGLELSLCQRYYEKIVASLRAYADGGGAYWTIPMKVNKRNTPTVIQGTSYTGSNVAATTGVIGVSQENITYRLMPTTVGFCNIDNLSLELISEL